MKKWSRHLLAAGALALGMSAAHADDNNTLYFYNWTEYVPPGLLEQFTKETGIKAIYSTYESNETMYAKLKTYKDGAYDLVVPSTYYVDKMRKEGMIQKIDKSKLTNFSNLDPDMLNKPFDPNNDYSAPVSVKQLSLAPGERREILVDMSNGDEVSITCGEAASIVDRIRGFFEPSSILVSTLVLTLRPTGLLPLVTDSLPMRLLPTEIMAGSPIRSRDISLGDDPGINGQLWDVNRIDVTAQQGTWERWTVRADEPQAFHIEGVMFQIRNVNGAMPFPEDRGWKDTVWVDGQVELLVYFGQPSWAHFPFYFNSQTLEMADRGSIGQLLVNPVP